MGQRLEDAHDVVLRGQVEIAGRFVGHDDGRVVAQSTRDRHALLFTAGQVQDAFVGVFLRQMHLLEQIVDDFFLRLVEGLAGSVHRKNDVFSDGKVRQQIETLENHSDVVAAVAVTVLLGQVVSVVEDFSLRRVGQSRNQRQHGGLSGSGRSGDGVHLARMEIVADVFENALSAFGVGVAYIVKTQGRCLRCGLLHIRSHWESFQERSARICSGS